MVSKPMEADSDDEVLFGIYKLHTELAERVASEREGLNKLYSGMVAGVVAASVVMYRFAPDQKTAWVLPVLGILVSLSWILSIRSVTGRLSAKHCVLVAMEKELPFRFLSQENNEFTAHRFVRRKYSAQLMPNGFLILCVVWLIHLVVLA